MTALVAGRLTPTIGVIGCGTMGVGIAYVFALAGWETTVVEPSDERASAMLGIIADAASQGVARGKLHPDRAAAIPDSIRRIASIADLPVGLELVVETVPERFELKMQVLRELERRRPQVIATNTSALSIDALSRALTDPTTFLGMHFFNPVWSLPLVELVRGAETTESTICRARSAAEAIGKETITVSDTPGFATSRLDLIASLEAMRMVQDGVATAADIDRAMVTAYRHPMGPLRLSDIVGLDVRLDIARNLSTALGERYAPPRILEAKVAAGDLGRKTGRGFFDWPDDVVATLPQAPSPKGSAPR